MAPEFETFDRLTVLFSYGGPALTKSMDGGRIVREADYLRASMEQGDLLMLIAQEEVSGDGLPGGVQSVAPEDFARWLIEEAGRPRIRFLFTRELSLPMADGSVPMARQLVEGIGAVVAEFGIDVEYGELLEPEGYAVGQWVRFTDFYADRKVVMVAEGMLGVVRPDPYGVCTPGISVMVRPVGCDYEYGFPCGVVEPVGPPTEEDLKRAEDLARQGAWKLLREQNRWIGVVLPGLSAADALRELGALATRIRREEDVRVLKGNLKRVEKILKGFGPSPRGETALVLAERCRQEIMSALPSEIEELISDVESWAAAH